MLQESFAALELSVQIDGFVSSIKELGEGGDKTKQWPRKMSISLPLEHRVCYILLMASGASQYDKVKDFFHE